jgi:hypothetical protein
MTHSSLGETKPNSSRTWKGICRKFLQGNNGKYSTMRAMSFIALMAAIVFGAITITSNDPDGTEITIAFLVAAFAPKAVQRFAERA